MMLSRLPSTWRFISARRAWPRLGGADDLQDLLAVLTVAGQELGRSDEHRACQAPLTELTSIFQQFIAGFRSLPLICPRDRIG